MENEFGDQYGVDSLKQENKKYPGPVAAGLLFSLAAILLSYGNPLLIFKNNLLRSGLGEILFILAPVIILLLVGRYNIKDTLKLKNTKPVNYLIIVFLMIFGMPVVGILNIITLGIIRLIFGRNLPIEQINIPDGPTLFLAILVIGVSAAVCEEVLFRGLINKAYRHYGAVYSIVITSVLFGILHRDLQKIVSTIILGALIGYIVYRTGSIFAGMVAHFTNNTVAVLLSYVSTKMTQGMRYSEFNQDQIKNLDYFSNLPTATLIVAIIFYAILFMTCASMFIALIYAFQRITKSNITIEEEKRDKPRVSFSSAICILPGLILIALTFTGQLLELMQIKSGVLYNLLKLLALI